MTNNKVQEKRSQAARARRYYNEYQVRTRAKMLKRRSKEEMVRLFLMLLVQFISLCAGKRRH